MPEAPQPLIAGTVHDIGTAWRLLAVLVIAAATVAVSVVPGTARPGDSVFVWAVALTPTIVQKIMHVVVYAMLAGASVWALVDALPRRAAFAVALGFCILLGAGLEWVQLSVPGRFGTLTDALLDAVGTVLGLVLAALFL